MPTATHLQSGTIISNRSVDSVRPLKVICIGAGISGILAAINLPKQVQKLDLIIYEKNEELGGTWFENKYPGCACGGYSSLGCRVGLRLMYIRHTRPLLPTILRSQHRLVIILRKSPRDTGVLETSGRQVWMPEIYEARPQGARGTMGTKSCKVESQD